METLCDTSSFLLLIRIAPRMFIDDRLKCFTVREVWEEIFQTQKFQSRYPWRANFKREIKLKYFNLDNDESFKSFLDLIQRMIETGISNNITNRLFDLSRKDQKIIAYALALDSRLSTNDLDMSDFFEQQFDKQSMSSLALLNEWLENNIIVWNSEFQEAIQEWDRQNEPVQPSEDIENFERLTGNQYVGSR